MQPFILPLPICRLSNYLHNWHLTITYYVFRYLNKSIFFWLSGEKEKLRRNKMSCVTKPVISAAGTWRSRYCLFTHTATDEQSMGGNGWMMGIFILSFLIYRSRRKQRTWCFNRSQAQSVHSKSSNQSPTQQRSHSLLQIRSIRLKLTPPKQMQKKLRNLPKTKKMWTKQKTMDPLEGIYLPFFFYIYIIKLFGHYIFQSISCLLN